MGFFIVIEGLDGSGKTEISFQLSELLKNTSNLEVKLTYEPHTTSCAGLFIRQALRHKIKNVNLKTLALAFATNRIDHYQREILPFLEKSENVILISDRYYLSSLVYQVNNDLDLSLEKVMEYNNSVIKPDLTLFLNASDSNCYKRMRERNEKKELFEIRLKNTREK